MGDLPEGIGASVLSQAPAAGGLNKNESTKSIVKPGGKTGPSPALKPGQPPVVTSQLARNDSQASIVSQPEGPSPQELAI